MASIKLKGDTSLYWIRLSEHTDVLSNGYVGVSNNVEYRWNQHKSFATNAHLSNAINKYGWDNLVKEVILIADEAYCLMIEKLLRAKENIGWNIAIGGGKPPICKGGNVLSAETKSKISTTKTGVKLTGANLERAKKQAVEIGKATRFKKGVVHSPEVIAKISKSKTGRKLSEETKQKIRQKRIAYWKQIKEQN
jgi:group I intron endonuclease